MLSVHQFSNEKQVIKTNVILDLLNKTNESPSRMLFWVRNFIDSVRMIEGNEIEPMHSNISSASIAFINNGNYKKAITSFNKSIASQRDDVFYPLLPFDVSYFFLPIVLLKLERLDVLHEKWIKKSKRFGLFKEYMNHLIFFKILRQQT